MAEMKYKILFIDEESDQRRKFQRYMKAVADKVDVKVLLPSDSLDGMIEAIDNEHPDAIVSDFMLNEIKTEIQYTVPYNGTMLVEAYQKRHPDFPCFVMTSYGTSAVDNSSNVNLVYCKRLLVDNDFDIDAKFHDRIIKQIVIYRASIETTRKELLELLEKRSKGETDSTEESRIIELDTILEKSLDAESVVPKEMKEPRFFDMLGKLLEETENVLSKIDDIHGTEVQE